MLRRRWRHAEIQEGQILYDGINVKSIRKQDLRRSLGIVLQDVNLFTGTVMDNIRYGNPDATREECIKAAELVNADSFIRMLPQGYDTVLKGDGSGLSQGQRQLISIARAAVANPPCLILDEATSSIDTRTEAAVQAGMDALMEGRTVFVIAHRLSTIRNSDVIMVLDHGRIHRARHPRGAAGEEGRVLPAVHRRHRARLIRAGRTPDRVQRSCTTRRSSKPHAHAASTNVAPYPAPVCARRVKRLRKCRMRTMFWG